MAAKEEHLEVDIRPAAGEVQYAVTRDRLRDGSFQAALRAAAPPGAVFRSDAELSASLAETLVGRDPGEDVWVFAYGSLMWNPALNYVESSRADLRGWCRRFCIRTYAGRGAPETPGLMMALDRGGACRGIAFRIAAADVAEELALLWQREMLGGSYRARWVRSEIHGAPVTALTFVVNRQSGRYACGLSPARTAEMIAAGKGTLGTCSVYFETTFATLNALGIEDAGLKRIHDALAAA
jgi:cation transport protein ChaC